MCKQKVGRVKSAKLSFSKVLGSDCSQPWVRVGPAKPEGRPCRRNLHVLLAHVTCPFSFSPPRYIAV